MLMRSPWAPRLADTNDNATERLVLALADDIVEGRLNGGDRLPAHRDLAWKLGIGVGTVTKAYAALERRGLTRSVSGRGTFVASRQATADQGIDLSSNAPPAMLTSRLLARTLTGIARKIDVDHVNLYAPPAGYIEHRRLLARWLETLGVAADPSMMVLTSNARQAISLALDLACGPKGLIVTERLTYPGAIGLVARKGYRMIGVDIDAEGMMPEALASALHASSSDGPRAVYITPTLHNPTTATMSSARRKAIADICAQAGAWIIEDGVYGLAASSEPTFATLAPGLTFHVNSLSKSLGPGLRIGVLTLPPAMNAEAEKALRDLPMTPSPLSCAVLEDWMANDVVASIQRDVRREAQRRSSLAVRLLNTPGLVSHPDAYHAWLPMPKNAADWIAAAAAAIGVSVTPPSSLMVNPAEQESGIRLCLGGPSFERLSEALGLVARLLTSGPYLEQD